MKLRFRIALFVALVVIALWAGSAAFRLLNEPSDLSVAAGMIVLAGVFVGGPWVGAAILSTKKKGAANA